MKNFLNRLRVNALYYIFWVVYFIVARGVFLSVYYEKTSELSFLEIGKSFLYGLRLDASFAGYLSAIPFLLIFSSIFISKKIINPILKVGTYFFIGVITFWFLVDLNMYSHWGNRLDSTILMHIKTPKIMLASVSNTQLIGGLLLWLILSILICKFFNRHFNSILDKLQKGKLWELPIFLLLIGLLILPIRGGLQTIPVNQSNVYFSNKMFANHSALNFAWNFTNTLSHKTNKKNPYLFFDKEVTENIIQKRLQPLRTEVKDSILNTKNPNILLIVWESLSAKAVGVLNEEGIEATPNLSAFAKEGILFSNFYGNGERTDKGIPAILSGYYPQPATSIIKMVHKARKLPLLSSETKKMGYFNSFYYGGDMNFGNLNTYIRSGNMDKVVDGSNFDKSNWNSKWGAYDHIVLDQLQKDLSNQKEPFFTTILTLTSHEPYEIPGSYKFGKDSTEKLYLSSHYYTDETIGKFIAEAKTKPWWKNTLVIILSDHGHTFPKREGYFNKPSRFKIPMIWMGGALQKKGIVVDNYTSQIDIPYTLCSLLNRDTYKFPFGKNLFDNSNKQFVHYNFNNGFGILDKNGSFIYDHTGKQTVIKTGNYKELDSLGKAILQDAYQNFLDK